jgi:ParB family chromosome partitioning protein
MEINPKKSALGRGLGALIESSHYETKQEVEQKSAQGSAFLIDIQTIETNPFQPRKEFNEVSLQELSESIRHLGIIQPLTVKILSENKYQLISGERRLRASKMAGLEKVPAYIREADDQGLLELSLVENIHREDLNPIEIAISYQRLIDECRLTQEKLSERICKKRSTIANYLRMLNLPAEIQIGLRDRQITMGHAKAILNLEAPQLQIRLFFKVINEGLTVRATEEIAKLMNNPVVKPKKEPTPPMPEHFKHFNHQLNEKLAANIELKRNESGDGKIVIPFKSDDDLQRIMAIFEKLNS